uniref:Uncharacterized protein n=1 Tax=Arundo donax TaxID=35708 RepID=A0A0A9FA17_ARUDO
MPLCGHPQPQMHPEN